MNVSDKLQVIRALEETQAAHQRRSSWVAWGSVLVAAAVLAVMILAARRQLTTIERQVTSAQAELAAATANLASVQAKTDEALRDLQTVDGRGGTRAIESAVDSLIQARTMAAPAKGRGAQPPEVQVNPAPAERRTLVEQLYDSSPAVRVKAYDALLPRYQNDPTLVREILTVARQQPDNANGTYNALVVLSHMNAGTLRGQRDEIEALARSAQRIGPRVSERADTLLRRLPGATK